MGAITVSRQLGSQGNELALRVAQELGWQRVCRDLINKAALEAGVPHVALADIDELNLFGLRPSAGDWKMYQRQIERIILELAHMGDVVIVGRGGQMVLRGRADVLHLRIVAPFKARLQQLQQEQNISADAARARLEASDRTQARYLRRSHGVRIDDPALYHLIINTDLLGLSQAVCLVIETFRRLARLSAPQQSEEDYARRRSSMYGEEQ